MGATSLHVKCSLSDGRDKTGTLDGIIGPKDDITPCPTQPLDFPLCEPVGLLIVKTTLSWDFYYLQLNAS